MDEEEFIRIRRLYAEIIITSICDLHGIGKRFKKIKLGRYSRFSKWICFELKLKKEATEFFNKENEVFNLACLALGINADRMIDKVLLGDKRIAILLIKKIKKLVK